MLFWIGQSENASSKKGHLQRKSEYGENNVPEKVLAKSKGFECRTWFMVDFLAKVLSGQYYSATWHFQ